MARAPKVFAMVLAGGEGKRLAPLTDDRAKPAVPFGGHYRLIDFALSNLVNGGCLRIAVLTQYKSHSLDRHITQTWRLSPLLGNYVAPVPAQMRRGPRWFAGSADAVFQNLNLIHDEHPDHVLVFGADHIYRMDPRQMLEHHIASGAGVTVAAIRAPRAQASSFGVIEADGDMVKAFHEKPATAAGLSDSDDQVLASMGNYIFTTQALIDAVTIDAADSASFHDMGGNIIPMLTEPGEAAVYDFTTNEVPGVGEREHGYWRDVGTLDTYYDAHMDLVSVHPVFNLYNQDWPIYSWHDPLPPAKLVFDQTHVADSLLSGGVIVSGGTVRGSVLGPGVHIGDGAVVEDSVLMDCVTVEPYAVVKRAIIDKNVVVPGGSRVGVDRHDDAAQFMVSDGGVVVVGKNQKIID